jgi:hypothetical protein
VQIRAVNGIPARKGAIVAGNSALHVGGEGVVPGGGSGLAGLAGVDAGWDGTLEDRGGGGVEGGHSGHEGLE